MITMPAVLLNRLTSGEVRLSPYFASPRSLKNPHRQRPCTQPPTVSRYETPPTNLTASRISRSHESHLIRPVEYSYKPLDKLRRMHRLPVHLTSPDPSPHVAFALVLNTSPLRRLSNPATSTPKSVVIRPSSLSEVPLGWAVSVRGCAQEYSVARSRLRQADGQIYSILHAQQAFIPPSVVGSIRYLPSTIAVAHRVIRRDTRQV
ncbi:hypothetical protein R3P38DRAFT_3580236 [Favolaschia claudopus]|uniref:Uncharacterized protein n=1 Tax=Favolaschia claudopus TaxID=2862362 RepID=A0AAW0AL11_9AGAR